jgi:hypothetical protein
VLATVVGCSCSIGYKTHYSWDLGMLVFVANIAKGGMLIIGLGHVGTIINSSPGLVCCPGNKFTGMLKLGFFSIHVLVANELIGTIVLGFSIVVYVPT